jgi:alpha-ribazole phosphatase
MSIIYLLRHGEIEASAPRRFIGQLDLPLTRTGNQQISRLADFLGDLSINRLICSPLTRSRQSASILADRLKIPAETIAEMAEISLGSWEGLTVSEIKQRYPGQYETRGKNLVTFRPKNGESFQDLLDRTFPVFERICTSSNEKIVVVAHAGVNRVLLCRLLGMPLANLFLLGQDFGCINILNRDSQGFRVDSINYLPGKKP